jgi:acyl-coenzyme A synthetase/AMP-(fatty) acid ligase
MEGNSDNAAIIYEEEVFLYRDLLNLKTDADNALRAKGVAAGDVVALCADYSPASMAVLLSLIANRNIVVPISISLDKGGDQYLAISNPDFIVEVDQLSFRVSREENKPEKNKLIAQLGEESAPGLVLFTSGTTGIPKAVLHDLNKLMSKFIEADKKYTTLCFLMFDHIGGVDTYFYALFSGGLAVFPRSRDPGYVCELIETHAVEVLPVSPTFLNLILLSGAHREFDMSSLQIITFGSEKISDSLLARAEQGFSSARLVQKYGITEIGSPSSKTHPQDASLIKVVSDSVETRVVNGILYIRAATAMVGYLNAESPFTEDGWFNTGDAAEVHGDYIKILGRKSDLINVGGEKVFPAEIESVILEVENIAEVIVFGEENPIIGQMVCARVRLVEARDSDNVVLRLKAYCAERLEKHKVPVRIHISEDKLHSNRYKKVAGSAVGN